MIINREKQIKQLKEQKRKLQVCSLMLIGSILFTGCSKSNTKDKNNNSLDKNTYTKDFNNFEQWYSEARDVDTLVYIKDNTAILYEYDHCGDSYVSGDAINYRIMLPEGETASFPSKNCVLFPNHELAEEFVKNLLGEEANIICVYYSEHTEANKKKLVP